MNRFRQAEQTTGKRNHLYIAGCTITVFETKNRGSKLGKVQACGPATGVRLRKATHIVQGEYDAFFAPSRRLRKGLSNADYSDGGASLAVPGTGR